MLFTAVKLVQTDLKPYSLHMCAPVQEIAYIISFISGKWKNDVRGWYIINAQEVRTINLQNDFTNGF